MEKSTAFNLVQAVLGLSDRLNEIDAQVRAITDEVKKKELLKALGTIMLELDSGLIRALVQEHPDLDPDRARNAAGDWQIKP